MKIQIHDLGLKLFYIINDSGCYQTRELENVERQFLEIQMPQYRLFDAHYLGLDGDHYYTAHQTNNGSYHLLIALCETKRVTVLEANPMRIEMQTDTPIITDCGFVLDTMPIVKQRTNFIHCLVRKT